MADDNAPDGTGTSLSVVIQRNAGRAGGAGLLQTLDGAQRWLRGVPSGSKVNSEEGHQLSIAASEGGTGSRDGVAMLLHQSFNLYQRGDHPNVA